MEINRDIASSFPEPELFVDGPFSLKNQLSVMIDFVSREQAFFSLQEIFSQHFPVAQCFLIVRSELVPEGIEDLQIMFPPVKVYHRKKVSFLDAVMQLSKILDTQFVAAFTNTELINKWKVAEAINKITCKESWKIILNPKAISFVALRLALENAPQSSIQELASAVVEREI